MVWRALMILSEKVVAGTGLVHIAIAHSRHSRGDICNNINPSASVWNLACCQVVMVSEGVLFNFHLIGIRRLEESSSFSF